MTLKCEHSQADCNCTYLVHVIVLFSYYIYSPWLCCSCSTVNVTNVPKLRLLSFNVRGLRNKTKHKHLFHVFRKKRYDFVMLQEVHSTENDVKIWTSQWGGKCFFSHGSNMSRGVHTLARRDLDFTINSVVKDEEGRMLILDVTAKENSFVLTNVYAPNEDRPQFFTKVFNEVVACDSPEYIASGDFNLAINNIIDRDNPAANNQRSAELLTHLLDQYDMCDIWRLLHPGAKGYTWQRDRLDKRISRLDYFFLSASLSPRVLECSVESSLGYSDHAMLSLCLSSGTVARGPGYWKLNARHLQNMEFVNTVNDVIDLALDVSKQLDHDERWEFIKTEVIDCCRNLSINIAKDKNQHASDLESRIEKMQCDIQVLPFVTEEMKNGLEDLITKYHDLIQEKVDASIFRNKVKWYEQGERSSRYYFALEKYKYNKKTISVLKRENGSIIDRDNDILNELAQHYKKLYTKNPNVNFNMGHLPGPRLSSKQSRDTNVKLSYDELSLSLSQMPNGKTCGCDGLNTEFYKMFWKKIGHVLHEAILKSIEHGSLYKSALRGIITLIPKKDRDLLLTKNWRPLTMLNVDFKILSKALANRMKSVLPDIISEDQTGFMKGRNITTNIRRAIEVMKYAAKHNIEAILLSIDFQTCFDLINQDSIFACLEYFGFGNNFINMICLLFCNFELAVQNNGYISSFFEQSSGTHQGDPSASFLYLVWRIS